MFYRKNGSLYYMGVIIWFNLYLRFAANLSPTIMQTLSNEGGIVLPSFGGATLLQSSTTTTSCPARRVSTTAWLPKVKYIRRDSMDSYSHRARAMSHSLCAIDRV